VTATTGPMVIASTTPLLSRPQVVGGGRITACLDQPRTPPHI
jgi:hypothetical protein